MATRTAAIATTVVRLAISIMRRIFWNSAACSGVWAGKSVSLMQGSSSEGSSSGRLKVTVSGTEGSARLDRVLAAHLTGLSRSRLKALILAGQVSLQVSPQVSLQVSPGKSPAATAPVRDPAYHVAVGDTIIID